VPDPDGAAPALSLATPPDGATLSRKQRAIASYIEHNPKFAAFATAGELAQRVGVHAATVVRLAQLLGYDGYPDFQDAVRHRYLSSLDATALLSAHAPVVRGSVGLASIDQDLRNLTALRHGLDAGAVVRAATVIREARGRLFVGAGSQAGLATIFAHLCACVGVPVEAELRGGLNLATRLAALGPGDVVIGAGSWRIVRETREALAVARERGAATVAIVDAASSPLAEVADHLLTARTEGVSFFQSMVGPLAVLNALVAEVAHADEPAAQERVDACADLYRRLGAVWDEPVAKPANGRGAPDGAAATDRGRPRPRRRSTDA